MKGDGDVPVKATKTSFEIIRTLLEYEAAGTSELADVLDLPTSTVHDHLQTLHEIGYVNRTDGTYTVGPRFLELGGYVRKNMRIFQYGEPEIQKLAIETGEHANIMVEDGGLGVFIYKAIGEQAVRVDTYEGMYVHLHTTALGKSILAHTPEERVESILDTHGLPGITENTVTDREQLFEELAEIQSRGYAIDDEERVEGMRCVAAPIRGETDVLGAISVSAPTSRMRGDRFEEEIPNKVLSAANVIEVNSTYS